MFRRGKKKVPLLQTNYSLFNYLKTDKSAGANRISSQIVESVIDVTVYHGKNIATDIVNEIENNVTRDVNSNNNDDYLELNYKNTLLQIKRFCNGRQNFPG